MPQLTLTGEIIEDDTKDDVKKDDIVSQSLSQSLIMADPKWDVMRHRMADLEARLNELSEGKFYGDYAARGLETYRLFEMKHLAKTCSPEFMQVLRDAVILHRDFYIGYMELVDLLDAKQDVSCFNIARMCQWLGIPAGKEGLTGEIR